MAPSDYYLPAFFIILAGGYIVNFIIETLDIGHASPVLPREFEGYYDAEKYKRSQAYLKEKICSGLIEEGLFTLAVIIFILTGWFNPIDSFARAIRQGPVVTGLIFFGIVYLFAYLFSIPFSAYRIFVIEEKYGFNRTTAGTFIADLAKSLLLSILFGAIALSAILWLLGLSKEWGWFYSWMAVAVFQLFLIFIAPVALMPLFNKFTPLEEGELKSAILQYAGSQDFKIKGIYKMDASRRTSKLNAFFTGLGRYKRIALFDTLIDKMKTYELVAVLAHEIGHCKHKDIIKSIAVSFVRTGLGFFLLPFFIYSGGLFTAFKADIPSIHVGIFFFIFLYSPVERLFSVAANYISRRFESAADAFAVTTCKHPEAMINALKILSVDNLTNLTPHPLKVFLFYSHTPVLTRIEAIRSGPK